MSTEYMSTLISFLTFYSRKNRMSTRLMLDSFVMRVNEAANPRCPSSQETCPLLVDLDLLSTEPVPLTTVKALVGDSTGVVAAAEITLVGESTDAVVAAGRIASKGVLAVVAALPMGLVMNQPTLYVHHHK